MRSLEVFGGTTKASGILDMTTAAGFSSATGTSDFMSTKGASDIVDTTKRSRTSVAEGNTMTDGGDGECTF